MRVRRYIGVVGVALAGALALSANTASTPVNTYSKDAYIYEPTTEYLFRPIPPIGDWAAKVPDQHLEIRHTLERHPISKVIKRNPVVTVRPKPIVPSVGYWRLDNNISWYGPGFYGHRTACGLALTKTLIGVAHRTLPCGALVTFKWGGITITAPVVDRGPYVSGRIFDMTGGLCVALHHCFTGKIYYHIGVK